MCNHDNAFNIVRTKDTHMITDVICADCNESLMEIIADQKEIIEQQEKYAELGRLLLENKNDGGIHICYSKAYKINKIGCKHCDCKKICQLRAELLKVEVKQDENI
jgi:hypothetical protein